MSDRQKCEVCGKGLVVTWCDHHGIGACVTCGLPYRIFHYDESDRRIDKAPEVAVKAEWLPAAKAYWKERLRRVFPAAYDFMQCSGRSYSGATVEDFQGFEAWLDSHPELHPAVPSPSTEQEGADKS